MLTEIRELAEEAEDPRHASLGAVELFRVLVERGEDALARTPDQLAVLREAGVVDAGAAGLLEIVRGIGAALAGEPIPEAPVEHAHEAGVDAIHQELSAYRYCTVFVVEGEELDADALERELERLGDSLLVVGDSTALKVHVHTDDPGGALALATAAGVVEGVEIANMHRQTEQREERLLEAVPDLGHTLETGVVAVVPGGGNRRLFESYGVDPRDRGRPDDEPVDRGHPRRDRGDARDRGARAAEQLERHPRGAAGGRARLQARARDPVALGPGRSGGDRALPAVAAGGGERRAAMTEALDQVATGEVTDRLARRRARRRRRYGRARTSAWRRARRSRRRPTSRRSPAPSSTGCSRTAPAS